SNFTSDTVNVIALPYFQIIAQGCKTQDSYLFQTDFINKLTWSAAGTSLPTTYAIYRDAALTDLAGTVPATQPLIFFDHNRDPHITYTYYIVGTDMFGISGAPVAVTVTQNC